MSVLYILLAFDSMIGDTFCFHLTMSSGSILYMRYVDDVDVMYARVKNFGGPILFSDLDFCMVSCSHIYI